MTFAIRPYDVRRERTLLMAESMQWNAIPVTGLIMGFEPQIRDVDHSPLLEIESKTVVVSAFKRCHGRKGTLLRLYNAGPRATVAKVRFPAAKRLVAAGMDEKRLGRAALRPDKGVFSVAMAPWSLGSFLVE
jgi:alpha-mannosidase